MRKSCGLTKRETLNKKPPYPHASVTERTLLKPPNPPRVSVAEQQPLTLTQGDRLCDRLIQRVQDNQQG
jgi:hypothetical protein